MCPATVVSPVHPHFCRQCDVQQRPFCPLPEALRLAFENVKTTAGFRKGQEVFREGDPCHNVFVVCSGSLKLTICSSLGKVLLLQFSGPGDIVGVAEAVRGGAPYDYSAVAAEPSIVAAIPRETFLKLVQSNPELRVRLTVSLSEQYKTAQRATHLLAFGDTTTARLARLLLERGGDQAGRTPDRITHNELAQSIGATRETVTRILGDLGGRGIVERTPEGLLIRSTEELSRLGTY